MNIYVLRQLDTNQDLKMSTLAKALKIKSVELVKYLASELDMDINLYLRLVDALHADLDDVVFCKETVKNSRFTSKFENALKNGKDAIDSLHKQKTNLMEADSYGYYLLEYAMEQKNTEMVDYILSRKYFKLADDSYLKKHPINNQDLEYVFHVLVYILKYQLKNHYGLISKFNQYNRGIFSNVGEELKFCFLYYLNGNEMTEALDVIFKQKVKNNYLTSKAGEEPFNYANLAKYAIMYKLNFICGYLGKVMVDFKEFISEADKYKYQEGIDSFVKNMDSDAISKNKSFKNDAQSIFIKYCKEKNVPIVKSLIDKKIYSDINDGFEIALKDDVEELYQYMISNAYDDMNKDVALLKACKYNRLQLVEFFLKDVTLKTKNEVLKNVKTDPKTMVMLLKAGAEFENHSSSLNQMSLVINYLIKGDDKKEETKTTKKKKQTKAKEDAK